MTLLGLRLLKWFSILIGSAICSSAIAHCYREAAAAYGVPEALLRAIAKVESGSRDARTVENRNADGSRDIGRMQINTGWLPVLERFGIDEERLRDECTSIKVGAWIMAQNVGKHGLNWTAVGSYNVGCRKLSKEECERRRNLYAWKVFHAIKPELKQEQRTVQVAKVRGSGIGKVEFGDEIVLE
jgi:soluble lytic murein transglycosylase-like protein